MKKYSRLIITTILFILLLAAVVFAVFRFSSLQNKEVLPIDENNADNFLTFESEKGKQLKLNMPIKDEDLKCPLEILGEVKGGWFFEAEFGIELLDEDGDEIESAIARAQGEWMTVEYVPFASQIDCSNLNLENMSLKFKVNNPSDMREFDDFITVDLAEI